MGTIPDSLIKDIREFFDKNEWKDEKDREEAKKFVYAIDLSVKYITNLTTREIHKAIGEYEKNSNKHINKVPIEKVINYKGNNKC